MLSLILALQHFKVYLTSSSPPTVVFSYHNPLTFIHKMKNKNQRLLRWSLLLQEYNFDIRHIKGNDNIISDALSRLMPALIACNLLFIRDKPLSVY